MKHELFDHMRKQMIPNDKTVNELFDKIDNLEKAKSVKEMGICGGLCCMYGGHCIFHTAAYQNAWGPRRYHNRLSLWFTGKYIGKSKFVSYRLTVLFIANT